MDLQLTGPLGRFALLLFLLQAGWSPVLLNPLPIDSKTMGLLEIAIREASTLLKTYEAIYGIMSAESIPSQVPGPPPSGAGRQELCSLEKLFRLHLSTVKKHHREVFGEPQEQEELRKRLNHAQNYLSYHIKEVEMLLGGDCPEPPTEASPHGDHAWQNRYDGGVIYRLTELLEVVRTVEKEIDQLLPRTRRATK